MGPAGKRPCPEFDSRCRWQLVKRDDEGRGTGVCSELERWSNSCVLNRPGSAGRDASQQGHAVARVS